MTAFSASTRRGPETSALQFASDELPVRDCSHIVRSFLNCGIILMMRSLRLLFALFATLIPGATAFAAGPSADGPHVHVQLVVPNAQLNPGESANAGLYFKLDQGWHVYWKNAGDSGEPPHIRWTLPDGVTASDLQFPAPKRLPLGPLMDFGYEDEVLFPLTLQVAKTVKPGPVVLNAKVAWLVCREVCIPGKAELEVNRAVPPTGVEVIEVQPDLDLYKRLASAVPSALPNSAKVIFAPTADGFRLSLQSGQRETEAAFFPADQNILSNPAPQTVTPTATGLILDLKKDPNIAAPPTQLSGVLELSGGRAYEITA